MLYRVFDASHDEVFDAVLATVTSRVVNARVLTENRSLGIVSIRLGTGPLSLGAQVTIAVGAITRERTEVALEAGGWRRTPLEVMSDLLERIERAVASISTSIGSEPAA